jgi:apolipoprotein N-acyltransferase
LLILPIGVSFLVEKKEKDLIAQQSRQGILQTAVIVQPNIDPYEKLNTLDLEVQCKRLKELSLQSIDSNTHLLLWPETALYSGGGIDESNLQSLTELQPVRDLLKQYPRLHLLTGIESYRVFPERHSLYARPIDNTGNYYELYNGALLTTHADTIQFYHKSMLVPGVETLPRFLLFMAPLFEKMGGTAGGYARQEKRIPLPLKNDLMIAPAICYESIYGDFLRPYIQNGADIIAIITNDGWWGNTPGYQQHQAYAKLRAIETRKWVLRSANTGISCFINPAGDITQQTEWWTPATLKQSFYVDTRTTFFVRYGDLIGKYSLLFSLLLTLWLIGQQIRLRKSSQPHP